MVNIEFEFGVVRNTHTKQHKGKIRPPNLVILALAGDIQQFRAKSSIEINHRINFDVYYSILSGISLQWSLCS
jgi:hypothetical protein